MSGQADKNEKLLSGKQIADHFGIDVHSIRRWRYQGCPAVIYNPKLIRYYLSEVEEWQRNRKVKIGLPIGKAKATPAVMAA